MSERTWGWACRWGKVKADGKVFVSVAEVVRTDLETTGPGKVSEGAGSRTLC